jgi:peptidoglycan LD-endopeptidase LytH
VDIARTAGTPLYAPLKGRIHSFQNNTQPFDYGPTIILEHVLDDDVRFYTLYGHLTLTSLDGLVEGNSIERGALLGYVGNKRENGGWNPHLHLQIITDMEDKRGDYPGVASKRDASKFLHLCPDPQLILGFPGKPLIF